MKMRLTIISCLLILFSSSLYGQYYYQYFDGAQSNLVITLDTSSSNVWQIGPPQKTIFNHAATSPNVLVTDTINYIPSNVRSSFEYTISHQPSSWGILAIQWKQKLDMDSGKDGGKIEFSIDGGLNWQSAFNNPYVYNFYGYDGINVGSLPTGEQVFTGVDSAWKDIWLCYDISWMNLNDKLLVRHTMISDSLDNNNEGWMIDNVIAHITITHTISGTEAHKPVRVSPNPTKGRIDIHLEKINAPHIIERMELLDANGKVIGTWENIPTRFFIDISDQANGIYFLDIRTNHKREVFKVMLQQ